MIEYDIRTTHGDGAVATLLADCVQAVAQLAIELGLAPCVITSSSLSRPVLVTRSGAIKGVGR